VFPDTYAETSSLLKSDDPLLVTGKLEKTEKGAKILVSRPSADNGRRGGHQRDPGPVGDIKLLQEARAQTTRRVCFTLRTDELPVERLDALKTIIQRYRGSVPTCLQFLIPERSRSTMPLPADFNVMAIDELRLEVERLFGYNAATFE